MLLLSASSHKRIYFSALILLVISLPFSMFTLSVAQIILTVNWIVEGGFKQKWNIIKKHPALWAITLFYLVHLVWMINSSDLGYGFHELKLKLPLLILPFIIATSESLTSKQLKIILNCYVSAVLAFSLYSGFLIFGFDGKPYHSMVELSPIVWHIRWALMVVLAIFFIFWLLVRKNRWYTQGLYITTVTWLIVYLFLLKSLTGIVIFIVTTIIMMTWFLFRQKKLMIRWFTIIGLLTVVLISASYLTHAYCRFHNFEKINCSNLDRFTAKGNSYWHDTITKYVENGHYINLYICEQELQDEWRKRSSLNYNGKTENGEIVKYCLIRYLTSKGLRKDAEGINRLTNREVKFIEHGTTNYIDTNRYALYPRIYVSIWELYHYNQGANPTGYSLSQRVEYLKTSANIIRKNFWLGVGTGDILSAFSKQYKIDQSSLPPDNRGLANNQLVTFWINFGIIGFILVFLALVTPPFLEKKTTDYLFLVIFIIGFLSFLDEDTFETHPGISMFAVFYSLFLFYKRYETT